MTAKLIRFLYLCVSYPILAGLNKKAKQKESQQGLNNEENCLWPKKERPLDLDIHLREGKQTFNVFLVVSGTPVFQVKKTTAASGQRPIGASLCSC